jgi:hypothetical protein
VPEVLRLTTEEVAMRRRPVGETVAQSATTLTKLEPGDRLTFDIWREDGFERVPVTVTVGQLDDAAKAVYRSGQCFGFALALQVITGWPLVFVARRSCDGDPTRAHVEVGSDCTCRFTHAAVQSDDGWYLDIDGMRPAEWVRSDAAKQNLQIEPATDAMLEAVLSSPAVTDQHFEAAVFFADALIRSMG